uniref:Uncharacterized protein n=1 Tax=Babesia bovis TaxID=5865 RepID=S6BH14_BABBO|nr:conserved hypothetical protein [Babesia bovis]
MSARPQEESIQEQPQATWTSTVPKPSQLFKTCCAPREGAIPITIPVYSPVYNGNQILSGTPGVIPHQQHVFAAPYVTGVTVPETIVSQRVSPQETIISNQGSNVYLQSENSIPVTSFSPNASIVHQTSIPAHTTTNFCNFANYIPTTESFSTVVPSCFSTCYPRVISNPADSMVTMRSIPTQPSIPMAATDVNCFNSCFGYNTNPLTSYQTQGTFGLRNLFTMNPYGQPAVPVDTLSRQLSSVSLQPSINDNSGVVHTAARTYRK